MAKASTPPRTIEPIKDNRFLSLIMEAVENYDLSSSPEWQDLDALSNHTELKAIEINPNSDLAYNNLGFVYIKKGKTDLAINSYLKAIKINPNNDRYYCRKGNSFKQLNFFEEAIE